MEKYAIVTPTFQPHFIYIKKYLKSFSKYLQDKENVRFYFTISQNEVSEFKEITQRFPDLNISILIFEDILENFNVTYTPNELLDKYKKFSFQTLKKFYTMLYIPEQYSLILDSESMAIRPFNVEKVFEDFFKEPFISGSEINERYWSEFSEAVNNNINSILKQQIPFFFLENFVWFYDKKHLANMFRKYGTPIEIVDKIYNQTDEGSMAREAGIFEIELYQAYIWSTLQQNKYKFINVTKALKNILDDTQFNTFIMQHNNRYQGNCGLLERSTEMLNVLPIKEMGNWLNRNHYNIIRCNNSNFENYRMQKCYLLAINPCILAASQDHCFGLNNTLKDKIYILFDENYWHLTKHWQKFINPLITPFRICLKWFAEGVSAVFYLIKCIVNILKNIDIIIEK